MDVSNATYVITFEVPRCITRFFNTGGIANHSIIKYKYHRLGSRAIHNISKYHSLGGRADHNVIKYHRLGSIADHIRIYIITNHIKLALTT